MTVELAFREFNLRFVDSCKFFLEQLHKLLVTYGIDSIKGHFPHRFNRPENQDYVGCIPCEEDFCAENFMPTEYKKFNLGMGNRRTLQTGTLRKN